MRLAVMAPTSALIAYFGRSTKQGIRKVLDDAVICRRRSRRGSPLLSRR